MRKPPAEPKPVLRDGKPVTIRTVRDGECRWPVGTEPELPMCANPVRPGTSFCEYHARRGFSGRP